MAQDFQEREESGAVGEEGDEEDDEEGGQDDDDTDEDIDYETQYT